MKEFIEKLIGRLEEEHERCINRYGVVGGNAPALEVKQCMEIVNQLAEEHNNDFCEWKIGEYGDSWKPNCCDDAYYLLGVRKFEFCPYCGKKIKVVD